ncbi:AAA family ATPase [Streptomyces sp. NPDC057686]|uniref:AAA family ATPase n=1 Tax=Streptomyces sp. NPDC057686 TaxID=3346212 RepID=UPI00369E6426
MSDKPACPDHHQYLPCHHINHLPPAARAENEKRFAAEPQATPTSETTSAEVVSSAATPSAAEFSAAEDPVAKAKQLRAEMETGRRITLKPATDITIRPVHWLWSDRIPLGALTLIAGREGIGKSTCAYQLTADITRGRLRGRYEGEPRAVIVAATEDSWEHTIVPRLIAADADLSLVYQVNVTTTEGTGGTLTLPSDISALGHVIEEVGAAALLLDPLMSRLHSSLDTHKDSQVRQALEPITALADKHRIAVLGLIHVNKSTGSDPLTRIMGSRAFAAVARATVFIMTDPEDDNVRLLGQPKNNLGRTDLPTLTFRINSAHVADTSEGPVFTGRLHWLGETTRSITEALADADGDSYARSATTEAGEWLTDHLTSRGGNDDSASIKEAGRKAGHSQDALKRARQRLRIESASAGFPRRTYWSLPGTQGTAGHAQSEQIPGETAPTALTAPTEPH